MLQQKYVYVYMLVVLGMALLAVNNSTLRTQPGQQSMRVTFEQEFESTVVSVSAPVSAPSQSVPTAAMVTVKIEPTQKNVRPNPYDAVRGAGKRDNNKKHASSSTSNSTNNTTRSSVGGTDADRGTPSSSSSTGTNKKNTKTKNPPTLIPDPPSDFQNAYVFSANEKLKQVYDGDCIHDNPGNHLHGLHAKATGVYSVETDEGRTND